MKEFNIPAFYRSSVIGAIKENRGKKAAIRAKKISRQQFLISDLCVLLFAISGFVTEWKMPLKSLTAQ